MNISIVKTNVKLVTDDEDDDDDDLGGELIEAKNSRELNNLWSPLGKREK